MIRTPVSHIPELPDVLMPFVQSASLFDSSCSPDARVWFADRDGGIYIKTAPKEALKTEMEMDSYFHSRGFGPEVLSYLQEDADWLVTRAILGEDCTHTQYLQDPQRLAQTLGRLLRMLHDTDTAGCPGPDLNNAYLAKAKLCRSEGTITPIFTDVSTVGEALALVQLFRPESRVLLHGDYCLPNILLNNWRFTGFIDVGGGGIGDRHIDLYWGCWSLQFNLKDRRWCSVFLDAYGRDAVDTEKIRILGAIEAFG